MRATVAGTVFLVSQHALERYALRASAFPDDPERARRQLGQVMAGCGTLGGQPGWVNEAAEPRHENEAVTWLLLGEDIAMPLVARNVGLVAVTCIARGGISDAARSGRREYKRKRRASRRRVREIRSWVGESGPRWQ